VDGSRLRTLLGVNFEVHGLGAPADGNGRVQRVKLTHHLRPVHDDDRPSYVCEEKVRHRGEMVPALAVERPVRQQPVHPLDAVLGPGLRGQRPPDTAQ